MASILIVDDSPDSQQLIARALDANELSVAASLDEARDAISSGTHFDLILLDLTLPDGDGLTLGSELFSGGLPSIPTIYISARTDVRDKVAAFAMGAEDYVEKPFDMIELHARVGARLNRLSRDAARESIIEVGAIRLRLDEVRATRFDGRVTTPLELSPKEFRLLHAMAARRGRLTTRDTLIQEVWRDSVVGPRTVDAHVSNLRSKIRDCDVAIESVRGLGYRLVCVGSESTNAPPR